MPTNRRKPTSTQYKLPLVLTPQPEGGFTVTSPLLPEPVMEGDSTDEAFANVVIELYEQLGKPLPQNARVAGTEFLSFETLVTPH
jgi:antitoxin HicB